MLSRLREIVAAAPALLAGGNGGLLTARPPGESISGGCAPVAPPVTSPVAPPVVAPVALPAAWSDGRPCTVVEREALISSLAPPPPRSGPSVLPSAKRRRTELPPIAEGAPVGLMEVPPPSPLHLPPSPSPLPPCPSISVSRLPLPPPLFQRPISRHPTPPHPPGWRWRAPLQAHRARLIDAVGRRDFDEARGRGARRRRAHRAAGQRLVLTTYH